MKDASAVHSGILYQKILGFSNIFIVRVDYILLVMVTILLIQPVTCVKTT